MHIITGLLLSALFTGRKQRPEHPLLQIGWPIRTKHLLPGRVRFEIPLMVGQTERLNAAVEQVGRIEGVESAGCSGVTGSVLICFDERKLDADLLFAALIRLLGLEKELERVPPSTVSKGITETGRALDQAVYSRTSGFIDLRTMVPLALGTIGLWRLLVQRTGSLPSALTMAWWAYASLSHNSRS